MSFLPFDIRFELVLRFKQRNFASHAFWSKFSPSLSSKPELSISVNGSPLIFAVVVVDFLCCERVDNVGEFVFSCWDNEDVWLTFFEPTLNELRSEFLNKTWISRSSNLSRTWIKRPWSSLYNVNKLSARSLRWRRIPSHNMGFWAKIKFKWMNWRFYMKRNSTFGYITFRSKCTNSCIKCK